MIQPSDRLWIAETLINAVCVTTKAYYGIFAELLGQLASSQIYPLWHRASSENPKIGASIFNYYIRYSMENERLEWQTALILI